MALSIIDLLCIAREKNIREVFLVISFIGLKEIFWGSVAVMLNDIWDYKSIELLRDGILSKALYLL